MLKALYVLLVGVFTFGLVPQVLAQENVAQPIEQTTQTIEESVTQINEDVTDSPGNSGNNEEKRAERIERYKTKVEERLAFAEERAIKNACKGAQTVTSRLLENVTRVKTNREQAYSNVTEKLNNLVEKLVAAGAETTVLESQIETMSNEAEIFLASITDYETILADLSELNCEVDPAAFKAALTAAKEQRVILVSSSQNLRKYYNDNIKPALIEIKQSLSAESEGEE